MCITKVNSLKSIKKLLNILFLIYKYCQLNITKKSKKNSEKRLKEGIKTFQKMKK